MDDLKSHEHKEAAHCCHWGKLSKVWKAIICVVFILIILAVGIKIGFKASHFKERSWGHVGQYGMMKYGAIDVQDKVAGCPFAQFGIKPQMMGRFWDKESGKGEKEGRDQLFGIITKIEGNKITISDNGAKEQVILSQSDTVIMSSSGPVSLTSLKTGSSIMSVGTINATTKQLEAKWINTY